MQLVWYPIFGIVAKGPGLVMTLPYHTGNFIFLTSIDDKTTNQVLRHLSCNVYQIITITGLTFVLWKLTVQTPEPVRKYSASGSPRQHMEL